MARLRSVTQAADELCVTPSAVSHRVKQLEQILGVRLFGRADFSLTTDGSAYLAHVREGLGALQRFPGQATATGRRRLKLAVTPTFARTILIPRLRQFTEAYPEIDLALQVSIPLLDVVAEDADLMIRFGTGDLSVVTEASCPCGRTSPRMLGWRGRTDEVTKVRGMFVHPRQADEVAARFPAVARWQAVVTRKEHEDGLAFHVELVAGTRPEQVVPGMVEAIREVMKLRGEVEVVPPGTIPASAKKIDDRRKWE